jgi:hypothetical protein
VVGLIGASAGLVVGNSSKYFGQRRDAWREARAAGLNVLADVRALRALPEGAGIATAQRLARTWAAERQMLATFRRGNYPNGLTAVEWVTVADAFAHLEARLPMAPDAESVAPDAESGSWWKEVQPQLRLIETVLADFKHDPSVVRHVSRAFVSKDFRHSRWPDGDRVSPQDGPARHGGTRAP